MPDPSSLSSLMPSMSEITAFLGQPASATISTTIAEAATVSLTWGAKATQWGMAAGIAIGVMAGGWMLASWAMVRVHNALTQAKVGDTVAQFLASTLRFLIILTAFIIAIIQLGMPIGTLTAVLGALALALGLGLKDTLTNVAAGIMLLVNRPFEAGDFIQWNEHRGTVKRINLFQTEMNTIDNIRIYVPNLNIWNNAVQNYTHNRTRMVEIRFGIDYRHGTAESRKAIEAAIAHEPLILPEPAPFIGLDALADNSVNYLVRVWVKTADWPKVRFTLLERIKAEVEAAGLTIPFPQRVIHMAPPVPAQPSRPTSKSKKKNKKKK